MQRDTYLLAPLAQNPVKSVRHITKEEFDHNTSWSSQSNHRVGLPNQSQMSNRSFISEKRIDIPTIQSIVLPNSVRIIPAEPISVTRQNFIPSSSLDYSQLSKSSQARLTPQFINHDFAHNGSARVPTEPQFSKNEPLRTIEIRHPPRITIMSPVEVIKPAQKVSESPVKPRVENDDVTSFSSEVLKLSFVKNSEAKEFQNQSPSLSKMKRSILISKSQNGGLSKKSGLRESMVTFDPKVHVKTFSDDLSFEKPEFPKIAEENSPATHFEVQRKPSIDTDSKKFLRESEDEPSDSEKEYELENVFNEARRKTRRTNKSLRDILNTPRISAIPFGNPKQSFAEQPQQPGQSIDPKFIALSVILVIVFSILFEIFTQSKSNPYL